MAYLSRMHGPSAPIPTHQRDDVPDWLAYLMLPFILIPVSILFLWSWLVRPSAWRF
jgi:hypothetical protein